MSESRDDSKIKNSNGGTKMKADLKVGQERCNNGMFLVVLAVKGNDALFLRTGDSPEYIIGREVVLDPDGDIEWSWGKYYSVFLDSAVSAFYDVAMVKEDDLLDMFIDKDEGESEDWLMEQSKGKVVLDDLGDIPPGIGVPVKK
jgi:hypothetical protein